MTELEFMKNYSSDALLERVQNSMAAATAGDDKAVTQETFALLLAQMLLKEMPEEFANPVLMALANDNTASGLFRSVAPPNVALGLTSANFTAAGIPANGGVPANPPLTGDETNRSAERYNAVINQFAVESNPRYTPGKLDSTWCNIYVWDVTSAMGAEIPHYVDPATGEPRKYPDTEGARELGAIATETWLETTGSDYGWLETTAEQAQYAANAGLPAITSSGAIGHVQMVIPSKDGNYNPQTGAAISQAGRNNYAYSTVNETYTQAAMPNVRYWVHS
ncbi:MAG: hypothetical protein LBM98_02115 [Oscillospiraceae bacterium]|jgi:hypothetical protein|nr:hypothetical protein [Oscillospiraceae bacterium]